jgi:hypothetical protein
MKTTMPSISTKETIIYHLNILNTKRERGTKTYDVGNIYFGL